MEPARTASGPLSVNALARRLGGSVLLSAVLPWATYQILTQRGVPSVAALAITAVFPAIGTAIGWVRLGRPDLLGILSLTFIGLSVAVALAIEDPRVILLRPSVTSAIFAILCFGSLAFGRPLMFYVARQFMAGWDRSRFASFDAQWQQPGFRLSMRRITVAWGCWLLVQSAGRVAAVELLDVSTFLATWPLVANVGTVAMIFWSVNYAQRGGGNAGGWCPAEHGAHLGEEARRALDRATEEAKRCRHGYVGTEHLLVALCEDDGPAARALHIAGVTAAAARTTLEMVVGPGNTPDWQELQYAPRLQSALRRAHELHRAAGASEIRTEHLLLGLLDETGGQAVNLLTYMSVDLDSLRARLVGDPPPPASPAVE